MRNRRLPFLLALLFIVAVTPVLVAPEMVTVAWVTAPGGVPVAHRESIPASSLAQWRLIKLAQSGVLYADVIGVRSLLETSSEPYDDRQWALLRLEAVDLFVRGATGAGLTIAVVDTGVDASHPQLAGKVLPGFDAYNTSGDGRIDPNGHGTHVAGIIAAAVDGAEGRGLASGVRILPVRVLDASGSADDADVARGVVWAVAHGADIISMSLGGNDADPVLARAVADAVAAGVAVVAAAGNSGPLSSATVYPAADPGVLGVAATSGDDQAAWFSTRGSWVDVAAPGVAILSTWPGNEWRIESGTSMATPYVSAAIAVVAQGAGISVLQAQARLVASATDIPVGSSTAKADGRDDLTGAGLIDPVAALAGSAPRKLSDRVVVPKSALPNDVKLPFLELPTLVMPKLPVLEPILPIKVMPPSVKPFDPVVPWVEPSPSSPGTVIVPSVGSRTSPTKTPGTRTAAPRTSELSLSIDRSRSGLVTVRARFGFIPARSVDVRITVGKLTFTRSTDALGRVSLGKTLSAVTARAQGRTARVGQAR